MKAIDLFESHIKRAESLLDLHKKWFPRGRPFSGGEPADLLRAVVVFSIAALDAYIHKRCIESVSNKLNVSNRLPEKCLEYVTKQFKNDGERDRVLISIALKPKPRRVILRLVEKNLSFQTFQKPDQLNVAFQIMEIDQPWTKLNKLTNLRPGRKKKGRKEDVRTALLELASRRDDIVHEGDYYVSMKHHGKLKSIQRSLISKQIEKLRRIVENVEKISS